MSECATSECTIGKAFTRLARLPVKPGCEEEHDNALEGFMTSLLELMEISCEIRAEKAEQERLGTDDGFFAHEMVKIQKSAHSK